MQYLLEWLYAVHGRSGVTMDGLVPLTYATIADWSRLMKVVPDPEDVNALFTLDAVLLSSGK